MQVEIAGLNKQLPIPVQVIKSVIVVLCHN